MTVDAVEKHPNADRLSIVKIRGYNCITANLEDGSPRYKQGDLVVYIPEASILPQPMLDCMGFVKDGKNMLSGTNGDRVKAVRLRGIISQGVLYPISREDGRLYPPLELDPGYVKGHNVVLGQDVSVQLGIKKWEPPVPVHMQGEVCNIGTQNTLNYDIENIQKYPDVIKPNEQVLITEKLHGTFCALGWVHSIDNEELLWGNFFAFSKGLGAQGLVFKNNEKNANNIYHKTLLKYYRTFLLLLDNLDIMRPDAVYVCGEIYGKGVQDLSYDATQEPNFRVFEIAIKKDGEITYYDIHMLTDNPFASVPLLYEGPFSGADIPALRDGKTALGGGNVREGVVIKLRTQRRDDVIGRVILKAVSPDYLDRKGNTTEYN
jgi:RNA ligase (TIGR02306 family)